jgi:hypothetical protein
MNHTNFKSIPYTKSRKVLSGLLARKTPVTIIIYMSDKNKKLKAQRINALDGMVYCTIMRLNSKIKSAY